MFTLLKTLNLFLFQKLRFPKIRKMSQTHSLTTSRLALFQDRFGRSLRFCYIVFDKEAISDIWRNENARYWWGVLNFNKNVILLLAIKTKLFLICRKTLKGFLSFSNILFHLKISFQPVIQGGQINRSQIGNIRTKRNKCQLEKPTLQLLKWNKCNYFHKQHSNNKIT